MHRSHSIPFLLCLAVAQVGNIPGTGIQQVEPMLLQIYTVSQDIVITPGAGFHFQDIAVRPVISCRRTDRIGLFCPFLRCSGKPDAFLSLQVIAVDFRHPFHLRHPGLQHLLHKRGVKCIGIRQVVCPRHRQIVPHCQLCQSVIQAAVPVNCRGILVRLCKLHPEGIGLRRRDLGTAALFQRCRKSTGNRKQHTGGSCPDWNGSVSHEIFSFHT